MAKSRIALVLRFFLRTEVDTTPLGSAFSSSRATVLLPWVIGVMVYLALLMVSASMSIDNTIARWRTDLADRITVVVPPALEGLDELSVTDARDSLLSFLRSDVSVSRAEEIPSTKLQHLLEPWLGAAAHVDGLPLPRMIEVDMRQVDSAAIAQLRARLTEHFPQALLDDHRFWRTRLLGVGRILQGIGFAAMLVSLATALVIVAFGVQMAMSKHATTIQLLRVMGADDSYITAQFLPAVRRAASVGSIMGLLVFLATYVLLRVVGAGFAPEGMGPHGWQWATVFFVPLFLFLAALAVLVFTMRDRLRDAP